MFFGCFQLRGLGAACCPRPKPRAALIYCAVPVNPAVCVPAPSVMDRLALFAPVVCVVSGRNCTVTTQLAPGASEVSATTCPPPFGPQVESARTIENSVGFVPVRVAWLSTLRVSLPLLVRVKIWVGARSAPTPRVALPKLREAGDQTALRTSATPVPDNPTGEPVTVTLAVMVSVPATAPVAVGLNTTLMVQVEPAASV